MCEESEMGKVASLRTPEGDYARLLRELAREVEAGKVLSSRVFWVQSDYKIKEFGVDRFDFQPGRGVSA